MKNQSFWTRFKYSLNGIRVAAFQEASFQTESVLGLAAIVIFAWLRPPLIWIALCVLSAGTSLALELVNTALERLADRLHPENHLSIQIAKDCAAGAVTVASFASAILGILTVLVGLGWLKP
ncbi:MAG TPA: diacylglycerol kinase [Steroidobacteraceae bacterium]|nr:diacylglycerol kinase [Steroidobacteraceae bacterium]